MSEISKGRRILRAALRVPLARGTLSIKIMPSALRPRLVALIGLTIGICVFASACYQERRATQIALDGVVADATDTARAYAEEAAAEFSEGSPLHLSRDLAIAVETKAINAMRVIDPQGHTVGEAFDLGQKDAWNSSPLVSPDTSPHSRVFVMYAPTLRVFGIGLLPHPTRVDVSYPIGEPSIGRVLLSHSTSTIDHARVQTVFLAITSGMLTLGACVLAAILVIRRPLRELETATQFVSGLSRHFGKTLAIAGSTLELQELTSAINWTSTTLHAQQQALQESEAQQRDLLDTLQEVVFEMNRKGRWVYLNRAWTQVTGYDVAESLNQSSHKHIYSEDLAQVRQLVVDILSGQRGDSRHTVRFITKRGDVRWLEAHVRASRNERDEIDGIVGTLIDVTGQQTVEQKLRDQIQFIEQLLDAIPVATYYRSNDGRFLGVNQAHTELFGCSRQDCLGKTAEEAMPLEHAKAHPPLVTASAEAVRTHETQVTSADNRTRHLICIQAPFHSADGMVAGVIGVFSDITERKQVEQAIADAGLFLNRTIDAVPTPIVVTDIAGRIVLVNDAWLQLSGIEQSTALGKRSEELDGVARQISATHIRTPGTVPANGLESELTVVDNRKETRRLVRRMSELRLPDESVMQINVISDITEISRAKMDLERQLRFVSELIEALPLPVLVKDRSERYVLINRAAELFFERPRAELLRMGPEASQPVDRIRESYETDKRVLVGRPVCYEAPYFSRNGPRRDMVVTKTAFTDPDASVAGIISTFADITERRQIERSLNVQYEIVRILTDATSVPHAVRQIMRVVGTALGYSVGTFWQVHPSGEYLKCEDFWCADERDSARLGAITQNLHVRKGFSLPGRIWASARPERKMHAPATSSIGQIGAGFGFPIKIGPDVVAVMQFLVGTGAEIDADVIAMLNAAGSQIGQFIERQRIHDSFRASEAAARKLSLVASHTGNAVVIMDIDGRIDWVNRAFVEMTGYVLEEVNGIRFEELLHGPDTDRATIKFISECMKEQRDLKAELLQYKKSNESYWISLDIQPVFSGEHELTNYVAIQTDITYRRLGEEALVAANLRLNLTLEGANLALWDWDCRTGTVFMNDVWSLMLGGPKADVVTNLSELAQIVHPESNVAMRAAVVPMLKGTADFFACLQQVKAMDGQWRWIYCHGKIVERDADGRALRVWGVNTDVTERHHADLALRQSDERYNLAISGSNEGIWDLDVANDTLYLSPRFAEALNTQIRNEGEAMERWHALFHPDDRPAEREALARHLLREEPYDLECRMVTTAGDFRWYRVRGKALRADTGLPYRITGFITDTTDYRNAREQLEETRDRLDSILRSAEDMIWSRSADLRTLFYINPAVCKVYGREPEEFYANPGLWIDALHEHDKAGVLTAISKIMKEGAAELEFRIVRPDGTTAWIHERSSIAYNTLGEALRIDTISSDITERKLREAELQMAKDAAEAATRSKSEFLANMSHEIRTPMNGIIGISDLAMKGKLSTEQREYIGMVRSSANALLELINDILDFSKIEAGLLHFEHTEFLLRDTLADAVKLHALRAEEKGLELIWRVDPAVPEVLVGDALRVRQVITNLLGNAIKFTAQGEVELCVGIADTAGTKTQLLFAVRDTGIGIADNKLEAVFQPFSQADMSTTRRYGGSGLGLTICDRLVKMMGGEMSVRSAPDQGSTFYFTAMFDIAPASVSKPDQEIPGLTGMKVLLCDANPAQLVAISELLHQWEIRCRTTDNMTEALLVLEQDATTDTPFELAIFDAGAGGSDQRRLIQKLRARAALQSLPIVLMMPVSASRPRTRTSGDPRVRRVTKPFSHLEFKQAIAQALGQSLPVLDQPSVETAPARALNILLAEDNEINIRFARGLLQGLGHTVSIAQNGLEAVKAVGASMDSPFDLVLMDVQMPIMSGLEATSAIRVLERGTSQHLPIIAMTANAMRGDRERCLEAGMDDYLSKPIVIAKLLEAINRNLPGPIEPVVMAHPLTETPGARPASPMHADEIAEDARPYNRKAILETLHGDMDALRELAQMFMTDHRLMLDEARRMIDDDNIDGLARVAHTLKGMIGNFAAAEASKAAESFYKLAHKGHKDKAEKALQRLELRLTDLSAALDRDLFHSAEAVRMAS